MAEKPQNPLNRKYLSTPFDRRATKMTVFDFRRQMTAEERAALFANVQRAIHRVFELHTARMTGSEQSSRNVGSDVTWWQFLRHNKQRCKKFL